MLTSTTMRHPQPSGLMITSAVLLLVCLTILLTFYPVPSWAVSHLYTFQKPSSTAEDPQVHLFIPMNKGAANERFCRGLHSAIVNGWDPIIINWDSDHPEPKKNKVYGWKTLLSSAAHTQNISPDDLVLLMDGSDAWLQLPPRTLLRRYKEYDGKIVVGADKVLWPRNYPQDAEYPESPLPSGVYGQEDDGADRPKPRYANSGTVLGPFESIIPLLDEWEEIFRDPEYNEEGDDQGGLNALLARGRVEVDYISRLFWVSASGADDVVWINTPTDPDYPVSPAHNIHQTPEDDLFPTDRGEVIPWHLYPPLAHHRHTGQVPVVLHLNDAWHKHYLEEKWKDNWWANKRFEGIVRERLDSGMVRFASGDGYRVEKFTEVCTMLQEE